MSKSPINTVPQTSPSPPPASHRRGAPVRGESWAERIKTLANMTGPEVAKMCAVWAADFEQFPEGVTLKDLVILATFRQLMTSPLPSPGLLKELVERAEGKARQSIDVNHTARIIEVRVQETVPVAQIEGPVEPTIEGELAVPDLVEAEDEDDPTD